MTQEIVQVTDFSAIEDAIELWALTGSALPQLQDDTGNDLSKVSWEGFSFERKRPYGVLSIVSDLSPGRPCTEQSKINEAGTDKIQTTFKSLFKWNVQIAFYQDSYDEDGNAIRTTARQYAKNLVDRYTLPPIKSILQSKNIAFHPLSRNIRGNVLDNTDDDKYIHQAIVEFRFSGINEIALKDSDFFETINDPAVTLHGE